jgi:uncharacterized protein YndB with AHSA1/START domain
MTLQITRTSPTTLTLTRYFAAPPQRVWDAHMQPALIRLWLKGDGATEMPICENDPRVGGKLHFVWQEPDGSGFTVQGVYEVVEAPHRTVHVETMFLPDPMPENRIETLFEPEGTGTRLTLIMSLPDEAAATALFASGMSDGMEGCYKLLESLHLATA